MLVDALQRRVDMSIAEGLLAEFDMEMASSRRTLERLPEDKLDWKPDPKSMSLGRLAGHVAEMPGWAALTMTTDELDFSKGAYTPAEAQSREHVLQLADENVKAARAAIAAASDADFTKPWTLRSGEQVFFTMPKIAVIRGMVMNHTIHHRGQLTVYYRMNGVPVPALYGPSADEPGFMASSATAS
jgi:uncharacterized damage-inducible protein DinB